MVKFGDYLKVQFKRIAKLLPGITVMIILLAVILGIAAYATVRDGEYYADQNRYSLGIVGSAENSLLRSGVFLLQNVDSSKNMVELIEFDDEDDARSAMRSGKISACILITDEFVGALDSLSGDAKLKYYATSGQKGITGVMMDEIAAVAGNVIVYTEKGVLTLDQAMRQEDMPDQQRYIQLTELFNSYITAIMNRDELLEIRELGMSDGLNTSCYYFSTLLLFLVMMIPFCGIWIFLGEREAAARFFAAKGLIPERQVLAEMIAFYGMNLFGLLIATIIIWLAQVKFGFDLVEFLKINAISLPLLFLNLFVPTMMFSAMGFFLLDALQGVVNKVLVTFIIDIFMAYVSGYFYPRAFFPDVVQHIGRLLPTGSALSFVADAFLGRMVLVPVLMMYVYTLVFIALSILVRRRRVRL